MIELRGEQGKTVIVDGPTIKIIKKGGIFSSRTEKTYNVRNITSVEVKKPGVIKPGFIRFSVAGSGPRTSDPYTMAGILGIDADEDTALFKSSEYQTALQIKEYVETYQERPASTRMSHSSAADEIVKLKALMDQGIITPSEYETKKRRLLES